MPGYIKITMVSSTNGIESAAIYMLVTMRPESGRPSSAGNRAYTKARARQIQIQCHGMDQAIRDGLMWNPTS